MSKPSLFFCFVLALLPGLRISAEAEEEELARVEELVRQLSSESYTEREGATTALAGAGPKAMQALQCAARSQDPEVRLRAQRLLTEIRIKSLEKEWIANLNNGYWAPLLGDTKGTPTALSVHDKPEKFDKSDEKDEQTEKFSAVDSALRWLALHQESDGYWDSKKYGAHQEEDVAQTGLALMAFLGAGQTEKVGRYKNNVKRATEWLQLIQRENGSYSRHVSVDGQSHALAAIAMAEAAGMGGVLTTRNSAQKAVAYSDQFHLQHAKGQEGAGRAARSVHADTVTTALFMMQLKSAKVAGLAVPHNAFDTIIEYLDAIEDREKLSFRPFRGGLVSPEHTLMATMSRQFLGWKPEDMEAIVAKAVKEFDGPTMNMRTSLPLVNYLGTLAVFQQGGQTWRDWDKKLRKELLDTQHIEGDMDGSWDPCERQAGAGRVATTALCSLCMEVYSRFLAIERFTEVSP